MSSNKYYITSNGSFIDEKQCIQHSRRNIRYVDLREDEVFHWKYIKRVKLPGGGYRYYYDESELKSLQATVNLGRKQSYQRAAERYRAEEDYARTSAARQSAWIKNTTAVGVPNKASTYQAWSKAVEEDEAARKKLASAVTAHEAADKRAQEVARKYEIKKITSFPARTISKGTVKVLNWLSSLGRKKK